ncbi:hypothetical protein WR25_09829 [Diploscapter pachys]|uniref:Uncharacterized protein n=1 Tax=Diploscapter pachys TaxID=2018661 RepID=A0A2A2LGV3_9BILA|nr:hypothetical protein WR25_09829 [Diploscapter pachys]
MDDESGIQKTSDDDSRSMRRELLSAAEAVDDLHVAMLMQSAQLHGCAQGYTDYLKTLLADRASCEPLMKRLSNIEVKIDEMQEEIAKNATSEVDVHLLCRDFTEMVTMKDSLLATEAKLKPFTDKMRFRDAFHRTAAGLYDKYASMYPLLNRARHHLEHVEQNLAKHSDEDVKQAIEALSSLCLSLEKIEQIIGPKSDKFTAQIANLKGASAELTRSIKVRQKF